MTTEAYRPTPRITALTEAFWTGGRDGALRIQRCTDCGYFVHPARAGVPALPRPGARVRRGERAGLLTTDR